MQALNTWSTIIAKLAEAPDSQSQAQTQADALIQVKKEYANVKHGFDDSEKDLKALEEAYQQAKQTLNNLEQQNQAIEQDTQTALAEQEQQKALALACQIAQLNVSLIKNRQQVANLENTVFALKGAVSHNRYSLFRLEQQLDTLNATTQLQQAQAQLQANKGIRTALHSIATLNARAASNDATEKPKNKALKSPHSKPESAEQIIERLKG